MLQEVTQDQISKELQQDYIRGMLAIVDDYIPADPPPQDVRAWPLWERLRTHVAAILRAADAEKIAAPTTRLMNDLGSLLMSKNIWHEAEILYRRAWAIDAASYGAEHPNVARDLNNLAQLLQATNRLAEAEPLMRRALAIDEASYGAEHPNVAIRLNNLAALLKATNRLAEAEPLMRHALDIDEASYGAEHPDVARDLNNLAALLQATNRLAEAEPLMRRNVEILLRFFVATGHHHPNEAQGLANYRGLLEAMDYTPERIDARLKEIAALFGVTFGNNT